MTRPEPLPKYTPSQVAVCPRCHSDLDDEGTGFWCTGCQDWLPFSEVILPDSIDDPDRGFHDD